MPKPKRDSEPRSPNFSRNDRDLLLTIFESNPQWKTTALSFRHDATTLRQKEEVWAQVLMKFNASASVKRTAEQLQKAFANLRQKAKKTYGNVSTKLDYCCHLCC